MAARKEPTTRLVTQKLLAEWLGVTPQWVRHLERQAGVLPVKSARGYDLKKCVSAYCEHLREINQAAGNGTGDLGSVEMADLDRTKKEVDIRVQEQRLAQYVQRVIEEARDELEGLLRSRLGKLREKVTRMRLTKAQRAELRRALDRVCGEVVDAG